MNKLFLNCKMLAFVYLVVKSLSDRVQRVSVHATEPFPFIKFFKTTLMFQGH